MSSEPLVTCIMITADRPKYIPKAIEYFLAQDYHQLEMVIIDDGNRPIRSLVPNVSNIRYFYYSKMSSIGSKRNLACEKAQGKIIMHWDDDDWHAEDWISRQIYEMLKSGADICGLEHVHFYSPITEVLWLGTDLNRNNKFYSQWLNGATLSYFKSYWEVHPFQDLNAGEDDLFLRSGDGLVYAHNYINGFVSLLHKKNSTIKFFEKNH